MEYWNLVLAGGGNHQATMVNPSRAETDSAIEQRKHEVISPRETVFLFSLSSMQPTENRPLCH